MKITDFGLAGLWAEAELAGELKELMDEERKGLSFIKLARDRVVAGTPPWMAPEQFEGEADVRSDIYSFGIVMYQMANKGGLPFSPKIGDSWEIAHQTYPVPKLNSKLFPMIERCLKKRPGERYQGFDELRRALERLYEEEFTKKTGEKPPSPPGKVVLEAWEHVNIGVSLANLGLLDEAIGEHQEAIRINPGHAGAHNNLGVALKLKGLLDEAIREWQEAIQINPEFAEVHCNLGVNLYYNKGFLDEAIREYQEAIRINPEYADTHFNLGNALTAKGLLDEAIKEYQEALRINPMLTEAHYNLGVDLNAKGFIDEAMGEWREAIRINPEFAPAHFNLGVGLEYKGLIDEAIKAYENFLKYAPPQYTGQVERIRQVIKQLKGQR